MSSFFLRCLLALASAAGAAAAHAASAVVTTPQVRAELVAHAPDGVAPGRPLLLGLKIEHQPHWHTYWKNPGDSGLPTTLEWKLPEGVAAGEIQWPTPKKLPIGPLMNFGYEGTLLLPVPATVGAGFGGSELKIGLKAEWLVCKDVCIPESGEFALTIPAQASTAMHGALFDAARRAAPVAAVGASGTAALDGEQLVVRIEGLPSDWLGKALELLPETTGVLANAVKPVTNWSGGVWTARLAIDPQRSEGPATMPVVLTRAGAEAGLALPVKVTTAWPAVAAQAPLPPVAPAPIEAPSGTAERVASPAGASTAPIGLATAIAFALVGGLLLNLMPCVFPVLSLKVLSFAKPDIDRHKLLAGGLAYTTGVVLSFVALAALLFALRAGGEQLGWGFQLQSPGVVAALAALFTLIGLNLAGVFDVGLVLPGNLAAARAKSPLVDHLLTGVLATAVAAPCTAPFMGASLGLAVTLPTAQAMLVFAALGIGMALPYLGATAWPGLARALPRPGLWMAHFKALMAFPMFGTVVWLLWVLGQQVGIDGAAALLALLVVLAFVAWALGSRQLKLRGRVGFGAVAIALLAFTLSWALPLWRVQAAVPTAATAGVDEPWQPWSAERVASLNALGRPVFVDFTAAWCVTCQFNKRTTLSDAAVMADFAARGVVTMRADWTRRDAAISAELTRLGRSGVPVYALYAPGQSRPKLLGEILSVAELREALTAIAGPRVSMQEPRP